jgi:hypothetical protein
MPKKTGKQGFFLASVLLACWMGPYLRRSLTFWKNEIYNSFFFLLIAVSIVVCQKKETTYNWSGNDIPNLRCSCDNFKRHLNSFYVP